MDDIRVCTHAGPGAQPVIKTVPWPTVGRKAALIKVGACGVCGTDLHILKGHWPEPLTSCIRAFNRATRAGGFKWGDTVVIQGSGPIGILAVAAAQEMGAGRVICVGAPETPRLALARKFGAEATVDIEKLHSPQARIDRVREIVGGFGADLVMDCSGH